LYVRHLLNGGVVNGRCGGRLVYASGVFDQYTPILAFPLKGGRDSTVGVVLLGARGHRYWSMDWGAHGATEGVGHFTYNVTWSWLAGLSKCHSLLMPDFTLLNTDCSALFHLPTGSIPSLIY
jgi:hypothetical protein